MSVPKDKVFKWKGRNVSEKVYLKRSKVSAAMKRKWEHARDESSKQMDEEEPSPKKGRRIVDIDVLSDALYCSSCKKPLSLKNIENERRHGLASIFSIRCDDCLLINKVPTSNHVQEPNNKNYVYNVNSRAALGALDAGMGCTHLNKLLVSLNIPPVEHHLFKRHERLIGSSIESVAKDSCREATKLEKQLTIENVDHISHMLPPHLDNSFIMPNPSNYNTQDAQMDTHTMLADTQVSNIEENISHFESTNTSSVEIPYNNPSKNSNLCFQTIPMESIHGDTRSLISLQDTCPEQQINQTVRVAVSYDMAFSKRGSGRNYDSLNGYGCLFGVYSQKILDYGNRNRKCKKCDNGHPVSDHDCRLNFYGSAKAMESDLAVELICSSAILKEFGVEVGILSGDDDSSSIAKVRANSTHEIIKLSDSNHVSKGISNQLFILKKQFKELSNDAINFLKRCFTYAVAQNLGNVECLKAAICSIPSHVFNQHENCGSWCGYTRDKENYEHATIPGGFTNELLRDPLTLLFNKIAQNAGKFAHGASTQRNENLNHVNATKCPKMRCYSLSESADYRYAASVCSINIGESYVEKVTQASTLSPSTKHTSKFYSDAAARRRKVSEKIKNKEFKSRRKLLQNNRNALRYRTEKEEGMTYAPGMGFAGQEFCNVPPTLSFISNESKSDSQAIVLFDLETAGLSKSSEILQIAAVCGEKFFEVYIKPTAPITPAASEKNHLKNVGGELYYRGNKVVTMPLNEALKAFKTFLFSCGNSCVLVAHNCNFDKSLLLYSLRKVKLLGEFEGLLDGFVDTSPLLRAAVNRHKNCSLGFLASEASISTNEAHNAIADVKILQQVLHHYKICDADIIEKRETLTLIIQREECDKSLTPLNDVITDVIKKRLIAANITFESLIDSYLSKGFDGIRSLFAEKVGSKSRVTNSSAVILKVVDFLNSIIV